MSLIVIALVLMLVSLYAGVRAYHHNTRTVFVFYLISFTWALALAYVNYLVQKVTDNQLMSLVCLFGASILLLNLYSCLESRFFRHHYVPALYAAKPLSTLSPVDRIAGLILYVTIAFPAWFVLVAMVCLYALRRWPAKRDCIATAITEGLDIDVKTSLILLSDETGWLDICLGIVLCVGSYVVMPQLEARLSLALPQAISLYSYVHCLVVVAFTLKPAISSTAKKVPHMRNFFHFAFLVSNRVAIICTIYGIRMTGMARYASALYAF